MVSALIDAIIALVLHCTLMIYTVQTG